MNSHFTRSQQQIMESVPSYNTRLQSRIRDTISNEFSEDIQQMNGAYNIRIILMKQVRNGMRISVALDKVMNMFVEQPHGMGKIVRRNL